MVAEPIKQAIEWARAFQSSQTGWIHFCKESEDMVTHETVPLYENGLFALALLRSRSVSDFIQGEALLTQILHCAVEGHFPRYLHEFPYVKDKLLWCKMLPILFWASRISQLSLETKELVSKRLEESVSFAKQDLSWAPTWVSSRLSFFSKNYFFVLSHKTEDLISLQMAEALGCDVSHLWPFLFKGWHRQLSIDTDSIEGCLYEKQGLQIRAYDLWMHVWHEGVSSRFAAYKDPKSLPTALTAYLQGALFQEKKQIPQESIKAQVPYTFFSQSQQPVFTIFDEVMSIALVIHQENVVVEKDGSDLIVRVFPQDPQGTLDDRASLFSWYVPAYAGIDIVIEGEKGLVFGTEETVSVRYQDKPSFAFSIEKILGEGRFRGQISRSNRPRQLYTKGPFQYMSFDWQISVRALDPIQVATSMTLRLSLASQSNPSQDPSREDHCPHTVLSL